MKFLKLHLIEKQSCDILYKYHIFIATLGIVTNAGFRKQFLHFYYKKIQRQQSLGTGQALFLFWGLCGKLLILPSIMARMFRKGNIPLQKEDCHLR